MKWLNVSVLAGVLVLAPLAALGATPGLPHQFYGTVSYDSGTTPAGLTVRALVGNTVIATATSVIQGNGKYGIMPDLLIVSDQTAGATLHFTVNGTLARETATFTNGALTNLNLTVPGSVGTITKTESDVITNQETVVAPSSPTLITMGSSLTVNVSSTESTTATISKVEKLSSGFFSGATAVLSGQNVLNAYEIKISGTGLAITVTMTYDDTGIDESTVKPYKYNGSAWVELTPYTKDTAANTLTFSIPAAATPYALFGSVAVVTQNNNNNSGGGGGGSSTNTITTTALTTEQKPYDANNDSKIDVLDFNALMVHWGEKGTTVVADFDGNGSVDVFDFNALMVHWTA